MKLENLFAFTETKIFQKRIESLTTTETLFALQNELLENPTKGKVIQGTSGARKGRIGDKKRGKAKAAAFVTFTFIWKKANEFICFFFTAKTSKTNFRPMKRNKLRV